MSSYLSSWVLENNLLLTLPFGLFFYLFMYSKLYFILNMVKSLHRWKCAILNRFLKYPLWLSYRFQEWAFLILIQILPLVYFSFSLDFIIEFLFVTLQHKSWIFNQITQLSYSYCNLVSQFLFFLFSIV